KLDLEPQAIIVYEGRGGQCEITAKQEDMGLGLRVQVGLDDDDDMQRLPERLVEQLRLVHLGLDVPLNRRGLQVLLWNVIVMHLVAILATWASPGIGASVGEVQRRVSAQLGDEVQMALLSCVQGVVVAKVTIQHQVGQRDTRGDKVQQ